MVKWFVYVQGLRGPEPQLWLSDQTDGGGKSEIAIFKRKLEPHEEKFSLAALSNMYKIVDKDTKT